MSERKPDNLRLLEGGRGHRTKAELARRGQQPHPPVTMPPMPKWLDTRARRKWRELADTLNEIGVLTAIDGDVLACYCQAYADHERLTAFLREHGETYTTPTGYPRARPEVALRNRARDEMCTFGSQLGIGAAARTKVHVKPPDGRPSPLDELRQRTKRD